MNRRFDGRTLSVAGTKAGDLIRWRSHQPQNIPMPGIPMPPPPMPPIRRPCHRRQHPIVGALLPAWRNIRVPVFSLRPAISGSTGRSDRSRATDPFPRCSSAHDGSGTGGPVSGWSKAERIYVSAYGEIGSERVTARLRVVLAGDHRVVDAVERRRSHRLELLVRQIDGVVERERIIQEIRPRECRRCGLGLRPPGANVRQDTIARIAPAARMKWRFMCSTPPPEVERRSGAYRDRMTDGGQFVLTG